NAKKIAARVTTAFQFTARLLGSTRGARAGEQLAQQQSPAASLCGNLRLGPVGNREHDAAIIHPQPGSTRSWIDSCQRRRGAVQKARRLAAPRIEFLSIRSDDDRSVFNCSKQHSQQAHETVPCYRGAVLRQGLRLPAPLLM